MVDTYGAEEAKVYYIEEVTYGTTPASPDMLGVGTVENVEPALDPGAIKVRGLGSRDLQAIKKGLRKVAMSLVYNIANIGFLSNVTELDSMSIEVLYERTAANISLNHKGCIIDRLRADCEIEGLLKMSADVIGQDLAVATAKIGNSYTPATGAVAGNESYIKKGGVAMERAEAYVWEIRNNLKRVPVIRAASAHLLKYLPVRHRQLTGEILFEFESKEEFDNVIADTDFSLEFGLGNSHKATFSNCKWDRVANPSRIEDLVSLRAPFTAKSVTIV